MRDKDTSAVRKMFQYSSLTEKPFDQWKCKEIQDDPNLGAGIQSHIKLCVFHHTYTQCRGKLCFKHFWLIVGIAKDPPYSGQNRNFFPKIRNGRVP